MGVETKSDVFIGAYEMFANMSVLKNLIEELTLGTTASFWVYTNTQVNFFNSGRTGVYEHPVYQEVENNDIIMTEYLFAELMGNLDVHELVTSGDYYAYS